MSNMPKRDRYWRETFTLPETPLVSPHPKKSGQVTERRVSNADILKAMQELSSRFISLEQKMNTNTVDTVVIKEKLKGINDQMKTACASCKTVCSKWHQNCFA